MLRDNDYLVYGEYRGSIRKEADYYYGRVLGMKKASLGYEGITLEELEKDFRDCVDFYIECCKEDCDEPEIPNYDDRIVINIG